MDAAAVSPRRPIADLGHFEAHLIRMTDPHETIASSRAEPRCRPWLAAAGAVMLVAALVWPWVLSGRDTFTQKSYDHDLFHLPLVRSFAAQWPGVDLSDYPSATGPGFHLALATLAQIFGTGETTLQFLGSLMAIGLVATVAWRFARWRGSALEGLLLTLPLCLSPYLLGNAIWLMTDNLSLWLLAVAILGASLTAATPARLVRWSIAAAAACFVRQINLWVLAPLVVAGWIASRSGTGLDEGAPAEVSGAGSRCHSAAASTKSATGRTLGGFGMLAWTALACIPAVLVVGGFAWLWGGLTPPSFQEFHAVSVQPAAIPYGLTLFGVYGCPLWLTIFVARGERGVVPRSIVVLASFGWAAFLIAGNSDAGLEVGRNGGWLWRLVAATPSPTGVSIVLAFGSAVGVALLVQLAALAAGRRRLGGAIAAMAALAAFLVAHAANRQLFERYFDPPVLLFLALFAALAWPRNDERRPDHPSPASGAFTVALAAMAAMQLAFATATLFLPLLRN